MKKHIFFAAVLSFAFLLSPFTSLRAQTFTDTTVNGQVLYFTLSGGVAMVTYENTDTPRYTSLSGDLVIPDSVTYNGTTYAVCKINNNAFTGCTGLTSVTLPRPLTHVNSGAFRDCTGLTTVNFNADSCLQISNSFPAAKLHPFLLLHK